MSRAGASRPVVFAEGHNMKPLTIAILTLACLFPGTAARAQSWKVPTQAERCPSKWGADDTRGSANHMKPESVLKADTAHQDR